MTTRMLPLMTRHRRDEAYDSLLQDVRATNELLDWETQRDLHVEAGLEPDHDPRCPWCGYRQCDGRYGDSSLCDN